MPWWYHVVESKHELQNPTSPEKIRRLGQSMALTPSSRVLDVGAGRGGPAVILAQAFGCRITCVERAQEFIEVARARVEELRLRHLIEIVEADGRQYSAEPGTYDAAMCLGASFIWDGLGGTLRALTPVVKPNGFVAVGEPYWRTWPLPEGYERDEGENFVTLLQTIGRFEAAGLTVVGLIDASLDDWDRYQSLHWLALDEWLKENPEHPDAQPFRDLDARHRERYLRWERDLLGWAIVVGRGSDSARGRD